MAPHDAKQTRSREEIMEHRGLAYLELYKRAEEATLPFLKFTRDDSLV